MSIRSHTMKDHEDLDLALEHFREVTASRAPAGLTLDIMSKLPSFVSPISLPRFFAMISLGAAMAAVACTLLIVSQEKASPPPLPEFGSLEAENLFSQP